MSRVLMIGAGGVATVAAFKIVQNQDVFTEFMIASRRKEKCDKLVKDIHAKGYKMDIQTAEVDADDVEQLKALFNSYKPELVINLTEYLAESVVSISILRIWDYHHSLHFLGVAYGACHIYEEVILAYHLLLCRIRRDDEFSELIILESLSVQILLIVGRAEVLHRHRLLVVDKHNLCLVLALSQTSVKGNADCPLCHIGWLDATVNHSFEVDYQVESHSVDIIGVSDDYILAPFYIVCI